MNKLSKMKCVECEVGGIPLTEEQAKGEIKNVQGWEWKGSIIEKKYTFKNFVESMTFVNKVADIAEEQGHHPNIFVSYNKVTITLTTHAIKGLSLNDFIMAAKIDEMG